METGSDAFPAMTEQANDRAASPPGPQRLYHIAGIGASAGGLEALELFFQKMPPNSGIGFVVIQHLSPDYKSLMVELLSKQTQMRVFRAEEEMLVEPDCIYLIPPKKNMRIFKGRLNLKEKDPGATINLPIDIFFRSLAKDQGERAVGIVLSGSGSDGMRGVRAIKEAGGMAMVQDEETAKFDGMPRSAISTGLMDYVLPPDEMPEALINFTRTKTRRDADDVETVSEKDEDSLARIIGLLRKQTGADFRNYKEGTIKRRIERRLHVNHIDTLGDYIRFVKRSPREITLLYKEILIGVTNFFRDPEAFEYLREKVAQRLVADRSPSDAIRVWCAGCSTGEEAYSLAILFSEVIAATGKAADVKIFATDIDGEAVNKAANGVFPESLAADISKDRLEHFFKKRDGYYQVRRGIREMVVFAKHDLITDPPFTRIDLVSCRNLLIYLKPELQKKVFDFFSFALSPDGFLFLGASESIGDFTEYFEQVHGRYKIYHRRGYMKSGLPRNLSIPPVSSEKRFRSLARDRQLSGYHDSMEIMEAICRTLVDVQGNACFVIDESNGLRYTFGDVGDFLSFPFGQTSLDIMDLMPRELGMAFSTAIHRAKKESKEIVYKDVHIKRNATTTHANLLVRPVHLVSSKRTFYMIFMETEKKPSGAGDSLSKRYDLSDQTREHIADLEHDLHYTRENLQATIEELETSNEELQATNEELVSSNEELQSTNEELQSVNEELYTVNTEYQNKIQELTDLNNDMVNLLRSTDIGTLFLDFGMQIRRFTPAVGNYINIIEKDMGRPLEDLAHRLKYPTFLEDAGVVLETGRSLSKEVTTADRAPVLIKMFPYLDEHDKAKGVVISFIDISASKKAEHELASLQKEKDVILDNLADAIVYMNQDLDIVWANPAVRDLFDRSPESLIGNKCYDLFPDRWAAADACSAGRALAEGVMKEELLDRGEDNTLLIKDIPIKDPSGKVRSIIEIIRRIGAGESARMC